MTCTQNNYCLVRTNTNLLPDEKNMEFTFLQLAHQEKNTSDNIRYGLEKMTGAIDSRSILKLL